MFRKTYSIRISEDSIINILFYVTIKIYFNWSFLSCENAEK